MHARSVSNSYGSVTAVFFHERGVERSVRELKCAGFTDGSLFIFGREYGEGEHVVGIYSRVQGVEACGTMRAFWEQLWKMVPGAAFLIVPQFGSLVVAGPLGRSTINAMEQVALARDVTSLEAGLVSLGISAPSALKYESALRAGKFLLVARGSDEDIESARRILQTSGAEDIDINELQPEPLTA